MPVVRIKICGITRLEDARAAADHGADAIGFMFYEGSPRQLDFQKAASISQALPPLIARVGVFVDAGLTVIEEAIRECGLTAVQLHGSESPEFCRQFTVPVIKAFRVQNLASLESLPSYQTQAWLLDAFVPGQHGGTGSRFNWNLAVQAQSLGRPLFLAGGLTRENVADAVRQVHPYALDVSSGVETEPGLKNRQKIQGFIQAARAAAE